MKNEKGTSQLNDANAPPRTPKNDFVIVPNSIIPQNYDLSTELLKIHRVMPATNLSKSIKALRCLANQCQKRRCAWRCIKTGGIEPPLLMGIEPLHKTQAFWRWISHDPRRQQKTKTAKKAGGETSLGHRAVGMMATFCRAKLGK